jgi:hypothetical protein
MIGRQHMPAVPTSSVLDADADLRRYGAARARPAQGEALRAGDWTLIQTGMPENTMTRTAYASVYEEN